MEGNKVKELLLKEIAWLYGGRDREGSPIIAFPTSSDQTESPISDVTATLTYLVGIPDVPSKTRGLTFLVDMRRCTVRYLKILLKALQVSARTLVKHVLVVKPLHWLEKSKLELDLRLEVYEFKILLVSAHKLNRYIDMSQLPVAFNGTFPYDHYKWMDVRLRYESFIRDGSAFLKRSDEASVAKNVTESSITQEELAEQARSLIPRGELLYQELKIDEDFLGQKTHPDNALAAGRVHTLIDQIKKSQGSLRQIVQKKTKEHGDVVLYKEFMEGVSNLSDWLLGPGENWLLTLHEIGDSRDEAEQLKRDHDQLEQKSEDIIRQGTELKALADHLLSTGHPHASDVRKRREYLDTLVKAFKDRVTHQHDVIMLSLQFHSTVDKFASALDEMLEHLCSDAITCDINTTEAAVQMLEMRMKTIDDSHEQVISMAEKFLKLLNEREQNSMGFEITRDYLPGILYVKQILDDVQDRKSRCSELADVRRLKLQQILQLYISERDAEQAVQWIKELSDAVAFRPPTSNSLTPEEAEEMQREHCKLEETAKSTQEYCRELLQVSLVLRRSCRLELAPYHKLQGKLQEVWAQFYKNLRDQTARLNVSMALYSSAANKSSDQLRDDVDVEHDHTKRQIVTKKAASEQETDQEVGVSQNGTVSKRTKQIMQMREQLREEITELRQMTNALKHQPPEKPTANPIARSASHSGPHALQHQEYRGIDDIQRRLDEMESRQQRIETAWEPISTLVRSLSMTNTSAHAQDDDEPPAKPHRTFYPQDLA